MPQPPKYERDKDFTLDFGNETDHSALNSEFDSAANSINDIRANLAILQADDGKLRPNVVTPDSISDDLIGVMINNIRDGVTDLLDQAIQEVEVANQASLVATSAKNAAQVSANAAAADRNAAGEYAEAAQQHAEASQSILDTLQDTATGLPSATGAALIGASDGASGSLWTTVAGFIAKIISSAGASVIGFIQAGAGAVWRSVQDKLRERISVKDFGAVGDGAADDTAAINAAYNEAKSTTGLLYFPPGRYKVTSSLNFAGDANHKFANIIAPRAGSDRYPDNGAIIEYYGTGYCVRFGDSFLSQYVDGLSFFSKAAGQTGVVMGGSRPQLRNSKITNFDQYGLKMGDGTSSSFQSYFARVDNVYIDYPGGSSSAVTSFAGPVGVAGIWIPGGFPAANANRFENCIVYGGYNKRLLIDGHNNTFNGGDLTYISSVASASVIEINGNGNIANGFYIEPGGSSVAPANWFVFGSTACGNRIEKYFSTAQIRQNGIVDNGYSNSVRSLAAGVNLPTIGRNESAINLVQNTRFEGLNGSPSVGSSPYGWVNFSSTAFTKDTSVIRGEKSSLKVIAPGGSNISCQQYLWSSTANRDRFDLFNADFFKDKQITFGCWVLSSVAGLGSVRSVLEGDTGNYSSSTASHSGSGNWEFLAASNRVGNGVGLTGVLVALRCEGSAGAGTVYFSEPIAVLGTELPHSMPAPLLSTEAFLHGRIVQAPFSTFADLDTTPSVATGNLFTVTNTSSTTITAFDDGYPGQEIKVMASNANTTVANNGNIQTTTSANKTLSSNTIYKYVYNGTKWYEF